MQKVNRDVTDAGSAGAAVIAQPDRIRERRWFKPERILSLQAYAFMLPSFIVLLIFSLIPIVAVAVLSFFIWNLLASPTFVGLENYGKMFGSAASWHTLLVTFYYVLLNIPLKTVFALFLAVLLNQNIPGRGIFRTIFVFVPLSLWGLLLLKALNYREVIGRTWSAKWYLRCLRCLLC